MPSETEIICIECNDTTTDGYKDTDGKSICSNCFHEEYCLCERCQEVYRLSESLDYEGLYYCEDCFHANYGFCSSCEELINRRDGYNSPGSDLLCENCFCDSCITCEACGETVWSDDAYYDENRDRYFCEYCFNENRLRVIKSWSYVPSFQLRKTKEEGKRLRLLYMGIELEISYRGPSNSMTERTKQLDEFLKQKYGELFYFKEDGSIGRGFEVVSHPFTWRYAHKNINFKEILEKIKSLGFVSYDSGECGLHIHLTRSYFNVKEILKMRLFFANNYNWLIKFSKRTSVNYCSKDNFDLDRYKGGRNSQDGRYWALNLSSHRTLEIRVFRGTLHYGRFLASLQFADAIGHYVKDSSVMKMIDKETKGLTSFIYWLKQINRYHHLYKVLKNLHREEEKCAL